MTAEGVETSLQRLEERPHPGPAEYVKVAVVLAIVTSIEVGAYYLTQIPKSALAGVLLVMMVIKFSLVVLWFMHLRFDSRLFRRLFVAGLVLAFVVYSVAMATLGLRYVR